MFWKCTHYFWHLRALSVSAGSPWFSALMNYMTLPRGRCVQQKGLAGIFPHSREKKTKPQNNKNKTQTNLLFTREENIHLYHSLRAADSLILGPWSELDSCAGSGEQS